MRQLFRATATGQGPGRDKYTISLMSPCEIVRHEILCAPQHDTWRHQTIMSNHTFAHATRSSMHYILRHCIGVTPMSCGQAHSFGAISLGSSTMSVPWLFLEIRDGNMRVALRELPWLSSGGVQWRTIKVIPFALTKFERPPTSYYSCSAAQITSFSTFPAPAR